MHVELFLDQGTARMDDADPRCIVGRDPAIAELLGSHESVSRRHAELYLQQGQVWVRDLGSSNGTWIDGQPVGFDWVPIRNGAQVFIGQAPLTARWVDPNGGNNATRMAQITPEMIAMVQAYMQRQQSGVAQPMQFASTPMGAPTVPPAGAGAMHAASVHGMTASVAPAAGSPAALAASAKAAASNSGGTLGVGGATGGLPAEYRYRRQDGNQNGVVLIALRDETFTNETTIDGWLEFTALDRETIASVYVELVECTGSRKRHVWDRQIVKQGPWNCQKQEILPMPFSLRVPPGTSMSSRTVFWEIRGYVDINWAFDVEIKVPINMGNHDIEKIRDAFGALDYRVVDIDSKPLGQSFTLTFQPPMQMQQRLNIRDIFVFVEYMGANLQVKIALDKQQYKRSEVTFELAKLRLAPLADLSAAIQHHINLTQA